MRWEKLSFLDLVLLGFIVILGIVFLAIFDDEERTI